MSLLVVAGEASGDRAAAAVIAKLPGVRSFGMGGGALRREGTELLVDLQTTTAMGIGEVARRAYGVGVAWSKLRAAIVARQPRAALLVNYTEFNARLAATLWKAGTRVLWYGAPQIWAWRPGRAAPLRRHLDRLAVMFPFEEALWRKQGVDAQYVGHPAIEELRSPEHRVVARELLGITPFCDAIALLPGSRPHEVRRLLEPMLDGFETLRRDRASIDARLLLASSLDEKTRVWARELCRSREVGVADVDAHAGIAYALPAFDTALCASGTASLECALARVPPIVCYRVGWATEAAARLLVDIPFIALPNILLGRGAFPELLQRDVDAGRISDALAQVLDGKDAFVEACAEVEHALGDRRAPSHDVSRMLEPWLALSSRTG